MPEFDVLIKGGIVFDGLRSPRRKADVAIKNGVIADIGSLRTSDAKSVIDASGKHVAPGFIDIHTHYDAQLFWDPYLTVSGNHGVTSVLMGNCGFGFAPVAEANREQAMLSMVRAEAIGLECMVEGMPWDWETYPEYLDSVERARKAVNVASLFPTSPMLIWAMGMKRAKAGALPTAKEHAVIRGLFEEALDAGAVGFSGRRNGQARDYDGTPIAGDVMHDETVFLLAEILNERNTGCIQYAYAGATEEDIAQNLNPAQMVAKNQLVIQAHLEKVAEVSGRPLFAGIQDYEWHRACQVRGLQIMPQGTVLPVPKTFVLCFAEEGTLTDASPAWREASIGSLESRLEYFADPDKRIRLADEAPLLAEQIGSLEEWTIAETYSPETTQFKGLTLPEISEKMGDKSLVDVLAHILACDQLLTKVMVPTGFHRRPDQNHEVLRNKLQYEASVPGISDGGAHTKLIASGRYPTDHISRLVRDFAWMSLEEMHYRLSAYVAYCIGLEKRGSIVKGNMADIVVYDYEALEAHPEEVVSDLPGGEWRLISRATGYQNILVNGVVTIEDDVPTGNNTAGRLLRSGEVGTKWKKPKS